jgi:membrane associated rhomboid family serine protease
MNDEKIKFRKGLAIALGFILAIWAVKIIELSFGISFIPYGVLPRHTSGLVGIIFYPLIHSNFEHLISNSFPILFLITALFYFYPSSSMKVLVLIYFVSGILLWIIGRESYHIGASGVVYGLITFTFFSGIIRWDRRSIVLSLIVTFLYGGFTWGVLPIDEKVSWEGHLSGALIGIICAFFFRKNDPYDKFAGMEDEEYDETFEGK